MANWQSMKLEVICELGESEFDEDKTEIRAARVDVDRVVMYYQASDENMVVLNFNDGGICRVQHSMAFVQSVVEGGK